ncbi:MAG TPA: hypothetical protein VHM23_23545 [Actinomycetota bacterium]|nr:hypothetical protein [Actinomycetota bacterium]
MTRLTRPNLASICEACFQDWCESCPDADLLGGSCCCGAWDSSNDEDEEELNW